MVLVVSFNSSWSRSLSLAVKSTCLFLTSFHDSQSMLAFISVLLSLCIFVKYSVRLTDIKDTSVVLRFDVINPGTYLPLPERVVFYAQAKSRK